MKRIAFAAGLAVLTSQQIAEQHGASFAEELLNSFADFSSEATTEFGVP